MLRVKELTPVKHGDKRGPDEIQNNVVTFSPLLKRSIHRGDSDSELGSPSKRRRIYKVKAWGDTSSDEGSPRKFMRGSGRRRQPMRGSVGGKRGGKGRLVSEVFLSRGGELDTSNKSKRVSFAQWPEIHSMSGTTVRFKEPPPRQSGISSDSDDGRGRNSKMKEETIGGKSKKTSVQENQFTADRRRRSSGSKTKARGGNSRKAPVHESSSSGGESGGGRKRASVQEVQVTEDKWQPISQDAIRVISDALLSAMGQSLEGVSGSRKRQAEQQLQEVIIRVKRTLQSTGAPTCGRFESYSTVRQRVSELKGKCLELVQANQEMEQKLQDRKRSVEEREQRVEQLHQAISSSSTVAPPPINLSQFPDLNQDTDDDGFLNLVADFVENSRLSSCNQRQLTDSSL